MSFIKSFTSLTPNTRIAVGVGIMFWGAAGLWLSDTAEKKLGFEPTEADRAALPKITVVDREDRLQKAQLELREGREQQ